MVYAKKINSYNKIDVKSFLSEVISFFSEELLNLKHKKILIKPNLLMDKKPSEGVTTHPIIIETLIEILIDKGFTNLFLGDGPGGFSINYEKVLESTGMRKILKKFPEVSLFKVSPNDYLIEEINGIELYISKAVENIDAVINIAKIKTHGLTVYTGAMKNLYGLIPGPFKKLYHYKYPAPKEFAEVITALNLKIKPFLNILDGIIGMQGDGPSGGFPAEIGYLLAGQDILSVDTAGAYLLGYEFKDVDYFKLAESYEIGSKEFTLVGDELQKGNFKLKSNKWINLSLSRFGKYLKKLFWIYPVFDDEKCVKCLMCLKSCPREAIYLDKDNKLKLNSKFCQSCLCCHELCGYNAIDLKKSLLAKLITGKRD